MPDFSPANIAAMIKALRAMAAARQVNTAFKREFEMYERGQGGAWLEVHGGDSDGKARQTIRAGVIALPTTARDYASYLLIQQRHFHGATPTTPAAGHLKQRP
jgi:hypothetical protein